MDPRQALRDFNFGEALLWCAIGAAFAVQALRGRHRPHSTVAAVAYLLFGASDFVEMWTGAWYRPWWLLTWKVAIVLAFAFTFVHYRAGRPGRMRAIE